MAEEPGNESGNLLEEMNPFERFFLILKLKELKNMLESIKKDMDEHFKENHDSREKKVGDKVKLWDLSSCIVKDNGRRLIYTENYFLDTEAIVIGEDLDFKYVYNAEEDESLNDEQKKFLKDINIEPATLILDILLRYPNGTDLYVCSEFIKRTDSFER